MKYEDMSDFEVNRGVAEFLGLAVMESQYLDYSDRDKNCVLIENDATAGQVVDYCNKPSDAWSVIVDSAISIQPVHKAAAGGYYKLSEIKFWTAWATNRQSIDSFTEDKNPLRAAMICFLKMKDSQQ